MGGTSGSGAGGGTAGDGARRAAPDVEGIQAFVRGLHPVDVTFLELRDALYDGDWGAMREDLQARLEGKPFIFKLAARIHEDLERFDRLRGFEERHGVNLMDVVRAMRGHGT